ncbi:hypothetical protein F5Y18DRAFT_444306 [Xylariaceae sp. FL1019]|nr:hypothetical protein F5Y18DRAFT_444306 [Xylariaceae sp. FL1019]
MSRNFKREERPPRPSQWGHEVVTFELDFPHKKFSVHAKLLAHFSPVARRVLNRNFREGTIYNFPFDNFTFDINNLSSTTLVNFITWIYQRSTVEEPDYGIRDKPFGRAQGVEDLVDSWLFGLEVEAAEFQNDMMKAIFSRRHELWTDNVMERRWSSLPVESPLDRIFFDAFCQALSRTTYTQEHYIQSAIDRFPERVVAKLARRMAHVGITGRWDFNDRGGGLGPGDPWGWLQVDNYMVEMEPGRDEYTIRKEEEYEAPQKLAELRALAEIVDEDDTTMDDEMEEDDTDHQYLEDEPDDCTENVDDE